MAQENTGHEMDGKRLQSISNGIVGKKDGTDTETVVETERVYLKRSITLPHATLNLLSGMIGTGVFVTPVAVLLYCGSPGVALIMWTVAGGLTLISALSYSEIGAMMPHTGGDYRFLKEVLGDVFGFLHAWMAVTILIPAVYAVFALIMVQYLLLIFYEDCKPPDLAVKLLSVWALAALVGFNLLYSKSVAQLNSFFALLKILTIFLLIGGGIYRVAIGKGQHISTFIGGAKVDAGSVVMSLYHAIYTYGGWQAVFAISEEVKNPVKNCPRAAILSVLSVTLLYVTTNFAYFIVLTPEEMIASEAVALTFSKKALGPLAPAVPVLVALSTIGSLNVFILSAARIPFAAARDGLLPSSLSLLHHRFRSPWVTLLLMLALSVVFVFTGSVLALIEYVSFVSRFSTTLVFFCVPYLRWKRPDLPRPIKVPIVLPIFAVIVSLFLFGTAIVQKPVTYGIGLCLYLSGVPVFILSQRYSGRALSKLSGEFTRFTQKLFLLGEAAR